MSRQKYVYKPARMTLNTAGNLPLVQLVAAPNYEADGSKLTGEAVDRFGAQIATALNEREALLTIARAAMACDIGQASKARLDAFAKLGDALKAYNGAPLAYRGPLNPNANQYAPDATWSPWEASRIGATSWHVSRMGKAADGLTVCEIYPEPGAGATVWDNAQAATQKALLLNGAQRNPSDPANYELTAPQGYSIGALEGGTYYASHDESATPHDHYATIANAVSAAWTHSLTGVWPLAD